MANEVFVHLHRDLGTPHTLLYGKCTEYPYVDNGLWFVFSQTIMMVGDSFPLQRYGTYFIPEEYAKPEYFDELHWPTPNHEKWMKVAKLFLPGRDWDPITEKHYSRMPYYTFRLKNGKPVRYGLVRSAKLGGYPERTPLSSFYSKFPEKELWYVAFNCEHERKIDWRDHHPDYYIVDKVCATPNFIEAMGDSEDNRTKWSNICWAHPQGNAPWDAALDAEPLPPNPFMYVSKEILG